MPQRRSSRHWAPGGMVDISYTSAARRCEENVQMRQALVHRRATLLRWTARMYPLRHNLGNILRVCSGSANEVQPASRRTQPAIIRGCRPPRSAPAPRRLLSGPQAAEPTVLLADVPTGDVDLKARERCLACCGSSTASTARRCCPDAEPRPWPQICTGRSWAPKAERGAAVSNRLVADSQA